MLENLWKRTRDRVACSFPRIRQAAGLILAVLVMIAGPLLFAFGQEAPVKSATETSRPDQSDSQGQDGKKPQPTAPRETTGESEKERLGVNPLTGLGTASGSYSPLTGKERWRLYWRQNYWSVGAYFGPVMSALILDQASGSPHEWGGGFAGFGRRLASRMGSAVIQGSMQAPVAALLHEDVRYIASTRPGVKRRFLHALAYSFLTYNSQGRPTLNIANLGSIYASTAISTSWLPDRENEVKYTLRNGSEQIALTIPVNLVQEFWPEIRRIVLRKH